MIEYRVYRFVYFMLGGPDYNPPRKEIVLHTTNLQTAQSAERNWKGGIQQREVSEWEEVR